MIYGKIKHWNSERGFGFAARDDGRPDIFIHIRSVKDEDVEELQVGQHVRFEEATNERNGKLEAVNVVLIEGAR